MKRVAALLLLALAATTAQAHPHGKHLQCELHSDYKMHMHGRAYVFTSDRDAARHVAIGGGRLFVNGEEVKLSAADHERVRRYEATLNRLVPQTQEIIAEATDIAFSALTEVARGFANDAGDRDTVARLEAEHAKVLADLKRRPVMLFDGEDIGDRIIQPMVAKYVPVIAGNAVSGALSVAFSGDSRKARDFERRMDRMGSEIERKVDDRVDALEPKLESLCEGTRELDRIEDGLALRLDDGEPLELLRTSR